MRLTIVNLFISGRMKGERKRSAGILARKPGQMNPPYAGGRDAAGAGYKIREATVARLAASSQRLGAWLPGSRLSVVASLRAAPRPGHEISRLVPRMLRSAK